MATEALTLLVRLNLAASAAIVLVLLLRPLVRRGFGAHGAYGLWLAVPLAAGPAAPLEAVRDRADAWLSAGPHGLALVAVWALGLVVSIGIVAWRYGRFLAQVRSGHAGPAILGVFMPRLVTPADFSTRFTPEERRLVRAHERAHMDRLDARWNALTLALQCLSWFNPLVHFAARAMRFDQELACDATVMARLPAERRRYAETLLCSHETVVSPLGCGWMDARSRPLATRITTLMRRRPGAGRRGLGTLLLAALWAVALAGAWAAQPPYRLPERPMILVMDLTPPTPAPPTKVRSGAPG
jgi:beta-lactamase regulating signal transducer with metallopeptidase domain